MNEENKKLKEEIKKLESVVEKLQFDIDTLQEWFYHYCKFCEHWKYQGFDTGRCANCPEFDAENNRIENTGSDKFGELTQGMDTCAAWKLLLSVKGKEEQLREGGKIAAIPGQRCSHCNNLLIDGRQSEHYILHVTLEVIDKEGTSRSKKFAFHSAVCLYRWLWKESEEEFSKTLEKLGWNSGKSEKD